MTAIATKHMQILISFDASQLSLETLKYQLEALTIDVKENKNAIKSISIESTQEPDQTKFNMGIEKTASVPKRGER
jgi:hypothetical protein